MQMQKWGQNMLKSNSNFFFNKISFYSPVFIKLYQQIQFGVKQIFK